MSITNNQLHVAAAIGTIALLGSMLGAGAYLALAKDDKGAVVPPLREMITIEASLARKSDKPTQPQKPVAPPEPTAKPEGVSHDADKKPDETKKEEPKRPTKPDEKPANFDKYRRNPDDEPSNGTPNAEAGAFDGSAKGFAAFNSGHPFWRELNGDLHENWTLPQISNVTGATVACIHMTPDGKIAEIKIDQSSGDEILDDSVQRALKAVQRIRNERPQPVPVEQLAAIRTWACLRFNPNQ